MLVQGPSGTAAVGERAPRPDPQARRTTAARGGARLRPTEEGTGRAGQSAFTNGTDGESHARGSLPARQLSPGVLRTWPRSQQSRGDNDNRTAYGSAWLEP
ncbi:hypothetical protein MTO96_020627 [Rhipicephalus appendiculatus]